MLFFCTDKSFKVRIGNKFSRIAWKQSWTETHWKRLDSNKAKNSRERNGNYPRPQENHQRRLIPAGAL